VFLFENMAIEAFMIIAIVAIAFIFAYILTAIVGEWHSARRARSSRRRRRAPRQAWDRARMAREER
jgi:peptidoglycan/LPS O-acetylase OafA/YrhL